MRLSTNVVSESDRPQRIEPKVKKPIAEQKTRWAPKRSAIQPLIGMKMARLIR